MKKVCVLAGGTSSEREVSLDSGRNVYDALVSLGHYDVELTRIDDDTLDALPADVDVCYIALHGGWGENGGVQRALDARCIPYTGPGADACRIAMDKIATKRILDAAGIPTAPWTVASASSPVDSSPFGYPCVVKAPRDGSSVGVYLVRSPEEFPKAVAGAAEVDAAKGREALVERYIAGREMTVAVLDGRALSAVEICAPGGWYGYDAKYLLDETRYLFPSDPFVPEMQRLAVEAFRAVGCRGVTRVDFRVDEDGRPFVLELNTSPGMTGHSLVPKAAAHDGMTFPSLCDTILNSAAHD